MADRVTFTRPAAERIGKAVRIVESGNREVSAWSVDLVQDPQRVFRMVTFTGSWSINSWKTVTLRNSTATLRAYNLFSGIAANCGGSPAGIARDGTAWYLIAAKCG